MFGAIGPVLVAMATGSLAPALLATGLAIEGGTGVAYNINQVSIRQAICPPRLLGRMNASVRFLVWGTLPLGGFLGGAFGALLGIRTTLWIAAAGGASAFLWLLPSPVPGMREIPQPMAEPRPAAGTEPVLGAVVEAPTT